jgi:hypothetical protein
MTPVTKRVWLVAVAARNAVSSTPSLTTPSLTTAVCSHWESRTLRPYSVTDRITVPQPTPRSAATCATLWASRPTR